MLLWKGIEICPYLIIYVVKKEQQKAINKKSIKSCQKALSKPQSPILAPKVRLIAFSANRDKIVRD